MASPTQQAEAFFLQAQRVMTGMHPPDDPHSHLDLELQLAIRNMAIGLGHLAMGVRATYILLEEVQKELQQKNRIR